MSFGPNAGYAINPARDLGPRLFAAISGWGSVAFPGTVHGAGLNFTAYFWIPIVGPLIGGSIGPFIYDFFIADVLKARGATPAEDVEPEGETDVERTGADVQTEGRTAREQ